MLLLAHLFACFFLFIGKYDIYTEKEEKRTWLSVEDSDFKDKSWHYKYFFAFYWIFQVITTVGYGDLPLDKGTKKEMWFSVMVEFCGLSFFSLLLGILSPIFKADDSFETFLINRMQEIDNWTLKIERSVPDVFLPCGLYFNIKEYVWVAMLYDYNMMIEEFGFYN